MTNQTNPTPAPTLTIVPLTRDMVGALLIAAFEGAVIAGLQVSRSGCGYARINASTLRALERRGLVTLHIGPDGGVLARLNCKGGAS